MSLAAYLKNLNSAETQWSLYVNPQNIDEYRVGQNCFENGGLSDGWVCVGNLESLSYGFQSTTEAIAQYLEDNKDEIEFNGRKVRVNRDGIMSAYSDGLLADEFQEFLETEAESIKEIWAENEAWEKVEELREYFLPGGEWQQEQAGYEVVYAC